MKPAPFTYVRPADLTEALGLLRDDEDAMILAGGQSLLPMLNLRVTAAEGIIDISHLPGLGEIVQRGDHLRIGALVTHAQLEDGAAPGPAGARLAQVAAGIAYRAIRNMGTVGGSLALADPAADWPACFLALDATVVVVSASGDRRIPIDAFLVDAYETTLQPGELVAAVDIPLPPPTGWGRAKIARKRGAFADSLAFAAIGGAAGGTRIALGGTNSRACLMQRTAAILDATPDAGTSELRPAIEADLDDLSEELSAYRRRCHLHTVLSAIAEARQ